MSACKSCGARMVWAETESGKRIPLDAVDEGGFDGLAIFDDGNLQVVGSKVTSYGSTPVVRYVKAGEGSYRSHFASCPEAGEWRKR